MKKAFWAEVTVSTKAVRPNQAKSRKGASVAETHGGKGASSSVKSGRQR